MQFLESEEKVPDKEIDRMHVRDNLKAVQLSRRKLNVVESTLLHWRSRLKSKPNPHTQPIALRKRRQNVRSEANWSLFYYKLVLERGKCLLQVSTREGGSVYYKLVLEREVVFITS